MEKVLKGLVTFQKMVFAKKKKLFASLSKQQKPSVLFVTCSDSRIDPSLLTQTDPGDLFILRNAGNLIPTYGAAIGGSTATIEYGVSVLQVKDIIVCGHTDCGAMQGLLNPEKLRELPAVKAWLQHAETTIRCCHHTGKCLSSARSSQDPSRCRNSIAPREFTPTRMGLFYRYGGSLGL